MPRSRPTLYPLIPGVAARPVSNPGSGAVGPDGQLNQHGVGEAGRLLPSHRIGHPGRIAPAHVEGEPVGRLPIRQALQPLQDHHHGQDRGWHRPVAWNRSANNSGGNNCCAPLAAGAEVIGGHEFLGSVVPAHEVPVRESDCLTDVLSLGSGQAS
jgi:hypothetical protein